MFAYKHYIEDGKLKRINLKCYDKADCLEGIYHDDLTKEIEDDLKGKTIDELLDLDFKGSRIGKKANSIVNKRLNSIKLTILKGKELLVSPVIPKR
ncbi:MAG: hypothetical protein GY830_03700 [Bacteroidetes bacterium]|nr:hypothetical protein [Bacteroidota bacterium]